MEKRHSVEIMQFYSHLQKFRETSNPCNLELRALISRNFCGKMQKENFLNFHTVKGLQNGNGTALYNNGNRYIGQFLDGFKHGIGKFLVNTIGDVYEGDFQNGLRNGEVRFLYNMK